MMKKMCIFFVLFATVLQLFDAKPQYGMEMPRSTGMMGGQMGPASRRGGYSQETIRERVVEQPYGMGMPGSGMMVEQMGTVSRRGGYNQGTIRETVVEQPYGREVIIEEEISSSTGRRRGKK